MTMFSNKTITGGKYYGLVAYKNGTSDILLIGENNKGDIHPVLPFRTVVDAEWGSLRQKYTKEFICELIQSRFAEKLNTQVFMSPETLEQAGRPKRARKQVVPFKSSSPLKRHRASEAVESDSERTESESGSSSSETVIY